MTYQNSKNIKKFKKKNLKTHLYTQAFCNELLSVQYIFPAVLLYVLIEYLIWYSTEHYIKYIFLVVFVSDFQVFCFLPCLVECNPYTLDSHSVGCLVLLLNLALLTVTS